MQSNTLHAAFHLFSCVFICAESRDKKKDESVILQLKKIISKVLFFYAKLCLSFFFFSSN
jgi:hypothetical protein